MSYKQIYIFQGLDSEYYKVGISNDWEVRMMHLQTNLPFVLSPVLIIVTDHAREIEHHVMKEYAERGVRGEWFRVPPGESEAWLHSMAGFMYICLTEWESRWSLRYCRIGLSWHFDVVPGDGSAFGQAIAI